MCAHEAHFCLHVWVEPILQFQPYLLQLAATLPGKHIESLYVFDFDHTLVDDNTDTWVQGVRPELQGVRRGQGECWTDYMDRIFQHTHKAGCGHEELLAWMCRLQLYPQALRAVQAVAECESAHAIIISDSNSVFIDCILRQSGVSEAFTEVLTNPAHFDSQGQLCVQRCHSHSCQLCAASPNMCKGTLLRSYLERSSGYQQVVYVGDGRGDHCPCLQLKEEDAVVCRKDYSLAKRLAKEPAAVKATVHVLNFTEELGDFIIRTFIKGSVTIP